MIVVCDEFDYDDYPVYAYVGPGSETARSMVDRYNKKPMQRVMECYAMHCDKLAQLGARRCMILEQPPLTGDQPERIAPVHIIEEEP